MAHFDARCSTHARGYAAALNNGHGMAAALVRMRLPAVVAMQQPIRDDDAIAFARIFYEVLAEGHQVDVAVSEGRIALSMAHQASYAWSTPVWHLRPSDGLLLELPGGPTARYDVFLSYDDSDRTQVEQLAVDLQERGMRPWFDRWHLLGGRLRRAELAAAIRNSLACAFFVGPHGFGLWMREEVELAQRRARRHPGFHPGTGSAAWRLQSSRPRKWTTAAVDQARLG